MLLHRPLLLWLPVGLTGMLSVVRGRPNWWHFMRCGYAL